jgi:hypothetical protein
MVIYTCILRRGADKYECYEGFLDFNKVDLEDYKNISVPSSSLKIDLLKKFEELHYVRLSFPPKYRNFISCLQLFEV